MRLSHTTSVRILYLTLAAAVVCRLRTSTLAGEVAFRSAAGSPHRVGADTGRPQVGDCNNDGMVAIGELITGVNIALGNTGVSACPIFDRNGDQMVAVNELIAAVNAALAGC